ncbi:MAG: undecaprenyl/decaprenyl-phosphate alpha-N-acetylglucosaminyl 1-phosphate transferase [Candidatus Levybacteria bacterium]|nr:undecaprenyl/decaprenyl-phosphate alpha-N-acetylglucosaminyl 1-phosphate transferase [Candidatus Levybacteria bacterium]
MPDITTLSLLPFVTALVATAVLTFFSIKLVKKLGLMDDPKLHKHPGIIHTKPIPRGGGIPLFFGALFASLFFLPFNSTTFAIFFAAFLALVIGVIDDKLNAQSKDVSPYLRFLVNILTAIIVVGSGVSIHFITNPFGPGVLQLDAIKFAIPMLPFSLLLSDVVSVLWLIWVMNMINWSKGVDGQMPGIVAISAIIIGILSLKLDPTGQGNFVDAQLSFIIAGAAVGFLLFNFYPAKIFPGYGATALYLLLGVASILTSAKLATAILVMAVPMVDALFIIIRRILNKKSPFQGDKKHLHHILLKLGYNQRQVALFYWSFSVILGLLALSLESKSKMFTIIMVIAFTGGALLFLHRITKSKNEELTS